jgi:hypothetical protein
MEIKMAKKKSVKEKPKKKDLSRKESDRKKSMTSDKLAKIHGVAISRTSQAAEAATGARATLNLGIDVENPGDKPLYVWATTKDYAYDPATRVLSVDLAEPVKQLPPYIKMISDHPRAPAQVVVNPKSRATIKVQIPAKVNRPGPPGGPTWVEDPIGPIDRVDVRLQHATEPIHHRAGEPPPEFRKRLREHGDVVRAEITPATEKEK